MRRAREQAHNNEMDNFCSRLSVVYLCVCTLLNEIDVTVLCVITSTMYVIMHTDKRPDAVLVRSFFARVRVI